MYIGHAGINDIYDLSKKFIREIGLDVGLLVDLGAHHGESLDHLRDLCRDDYVLVEPVTVSAAMIRRRIDSDKASNPRLHLVQAILGREAGSVGMHVFENDGGQSSNIFSDRKGRYGRSSIENVRRISYDDFDALFPQQIDFAKINIEGGEYQLIEDGFFHRKVRSFVMELHNEHVGDRTWKNALECLRDDFNVVTHGNLGYRYCFMSGMKCK